MKQTRVQPDSVLRRASDVRYRIVGEEGVAIRQDVPEAIVLNEVGARILDLADGENDVRTIIARLAEEFEAPLAELEADTIGYLQDLAELGVLTIDD